MVSEANLDRLRALGASWLVGTPKSMLKRFERQLLEESDWAKIEPGVGVKLCAAPDGSAETFVLENVVQTFASQIEKTEEIPKSFL